MEHEKFLFALILVLVSVVLIDKGISGMVVSQTCCLPPNCSQENLCYSGSPLLKYRLELVPLLYIALAIVLGILVFHTIFFRKS